jgi:AcrR family transcriptional regulator
MSLRAAARDLGVSSGAVYRHFADKEELLIEIAYNAFMDLRDAFLLVRPEGDIADSPEEAIDRSFRLGRIYMKFAHDNPTLWRLMFGRIGLRCRECRLMNNPDLMKYTVLDVASENFRDLWRTGALPREPNIQDIRYMWSALHGAADLAQSGARLDGEDYLEVADQTVRRNLRSVGCPEHLIVAPKRPVGD